MTSKLTISNIKHRSTKTTISATEAFIEAYCAPYPDGAREIIREKVRNEIEKVRKIK
ncbi:MAG: hypothetical protein PHT13_03220 [Methanosarcina sp.]|nr:hypothetical protein [Methanosarcina sp.]